MNSEENKDLVRRLTEEIDQKGSLDFIDKWFTPDYQAHFNGVDMDTAAFRETYSAVLSAFSAMRHEIHFMVAENDLVTAVMTVHATHTGEWEGIAATGRNVSVADIAAFRFQDGKVAEEWVVVDMAGLNQQLEAPSAD